jgi:hypothetical protein
MLNIPHTGRDPQSVSSDAQALELEISKAYEQLLIAATRAERMWFLRQLTLLVRQRGPEQIAHMEAARGLRAPATSNLARSDSCVRRRDSSVDGVVPLAS